MVLSMERWLGKIAVVTGASSGIGAAIADALVENGLIVVGLARRVDRIEKRSQELSSKKGKLYAFKTDMTRESDILEAFKWIEDNLGHVHVLVNNAGYGKEGYLSDGNTEIWRKILETNVLGLCIATREAVKIMRANQIKGHIIHINSILGHSVTIPRVNLYPGTKFAITALTETLRQEMNEFGTKIKVTSVSPGVVASEMTVFREDSTEERREFFKNRPSLQTEDIADAVVYVLSTPAHVQIHELTVKPVGEP